MPGLPLVGHDAGGARGRGVIPRLIHQTYPTLDLPAALAENVAQLKARNPRWTHTLYDDAAIEAFIRTHYDDSVWRDYDLIDPRYGSARADFFRYLLIYRLGGVYLDIKSTATRPLDEVLRPDDAYILSHWDNAPGASEAGMGRHAEVRDVPGGEFQQWHVMAEPGHPFLAAVIAAVRAGIARYHPLRGGTGKRAVLRLTGPIAYTRAIAPLRLAHPHRLVNARTELGLRYSVLGGHTSHMRLFATHYTQLDAPLLRRTYAGEFIARPWLTWVGALRRWNRRRKQQRPG